jgi:hypothetical protein
MIIIGNLKLTGTTERENEKKKNVFNAETLQLAELK